MAQSRDKKLLISLGKRISFLRDLKGWSQVELGYHAGLSKNYICDVENGRRNTSITSLNKIAVALGKSISDILKEVDGF